jgi:hypothetical protein
MSTISACRYSRLDHAHGHLQTTELRRLDLASKEIAKILTPVRFLSELLELEICIERDSIVRVR